MALKPDAETTTRDGCTCTSICSCGDDCDVGLVTPPLGEIRDWCNTGAVWFYIFVQFFNK